jgi:hypothetical protein
VKRLRLDDSHRVIGGSEKKPDIMNLLKKVAACKKSLSLNESQGEKMKIDTPIMKAVSGSIMNSPKKQEIQATKTNCVASSPSKSNKDKENKKSSPMIVLD